MSSEVPRQASELAAANAKVAHGGVQHGDNQPEATAAMQKRVADLNARFGRVTPVDPVAPLCHRRYQLPDLDGDTETLDILATPAAPENPPPAALWRHILGSINRTR